MIIDRKKYRKGLYLFPTGGLCYIMKNNISRENVEEIKNIVFENMKERKKYCYTDMEGKLFECKFHKENKSIYK